MNELFVESLRASETTDTVRKKGVQEENRPNEENKQVPFPHIHKQHMSSHVVTVNELFVESLRAF